MTKADFDWAVEEATKKKKADFSKVEYLTYNEGVCVQSMHVGSVPTRPSKGGIVDMPFDFTQIDKILPHPVYAWMSWVCALNPSDTTFEQLKPLIQEAYEYAKEKFSKKK